MAAVSSLSTTFTCRFTVHPSPGSTRQIAIFPRSSSTINCSGERETTWDEEDRNCKRRPLLSLGVGTLAVSLFPSSSLLAGEEEEEEVPPIPKNYGSFVDVEDGYSYYYPSDWREFDFRGHDSAFKDRYLQLQNVRVSFIPTAKSDVHDLGPLEEVVYNLVRHVYSAPTQMPTIFDMQERTVDGKSYYTFEFALTNRNFSRAAFATIAIGNGRYYTLIVGAVERRWKRVRNQLKVVADSFKLLDI